MPSANVDPEAPTKLAGGRKNKQKQAKQQKGGDKSNGCDGATSKASKSNKSLVDELKLFQNSNLLNQEDPLEQLHQQINQLIEDDDINRRRSRIAAAAVAAQQPTTVGALLDARLQEPGNATNSHLSSLSEPSMPAMQYQSQQQHQRLHANMPTTAVNFHPNQAAPYYASHQEVFTVKKGILWEQQNHERFHQRLFSRWKKRYFILTTDYLVCFKRSSSKVGHSEMGKFLYKIALTDVLKTEWLRPKRNDKGPIILHVKDRFDLMLWTKKENDEWMMLINESIGRLRIRKTIVSNGHQTANCAPMIADANQSEIQGLRSGFYENAFAPNQRNGDINRVEDGIMRQQATHNKNSVIVDPVETTNLRQPMGELTTGSSQTKASSRTSSGSRRHPSEAATPAASTTNGDAASMLASSKSEPIEHGSRGDKRTPTGQADANSSSASSVEQTLRTNHERLQRSENNSNDQGESRLSEAEPNDAAINKIPILDGLSDGVEEEQRERGPGKRGPGGQERVAGRRSGRIESRPVANLIRRDDSWHSLVSLTHVGESNMQGGQKASLYARHIIERGVNDGSSVIAGQAAAQRRQGAINIESTATPLRAAGRVPPTRQHSIQSHSRRLPPIGNAQQYAHSFDVPAPIPSSPSLHGGPNQGTQQTSALYHQRLLQLQLLHNSNNVDYIRANKAANESAPNDYQIYAPESVATTNHYGYYSMRSNLKSAASEFSFIRPNSSSFQQAHLATPMHSGALITARNSGPFSLSGCGSGGGGVGEQHQQGSGNMKSLAMPLSAAQNQFRLDHNNNNYPNADLNLVQNQTSVQLNQAYGNVHGSQIPDQALLSGPPIAPNRELPLKPNKRRQANHEQSDKSSRSSGIVSFFRKAFSRRSKRRSKLVESCSSSLAAFDSNLEPVHVTQSAFSTGSKSARAERAPSASQQNGQQQRMIDLIEAFTNKTALDQTRPAQVGAGVIPHQPVVADPDQFGSIRPKFVRDQHLGSPLHKSNSISTTSGFGGLNELSVYRNQLGADENGAMLRAQGHMASPLITRSTKVMSANLTPLFKNKDNAVEQLAGVERDVMSPRNMRHLPRPSSIYGQPSMIGSPVITPIRAGGGAEFGLHRNSMHAGSGHRDRLANVEFRRQRTINGPSLDTTKEVAEELSSPTAEMQRELLPNEQLYDHEINARLSYNVQDASSLMRASKLDAYYHRHQQRQAVVNPILQSPTINAIYDNHSSSANRFNELAYQSHYDNHRGVSSTIHDPDRDASGYSRPQLMMPNRMNEERLNGVLASPMMHRERAFANHNQNAPFCTPTREGSRQSQLVRSATTEVNRVFVRSKPAAIVAPTTPHRQSTNLTHQFEHRSDPLADAMLGSEHSAARFIGRQASPMRSQQAVASANEAVVSPIASRRSINQAQWRYQQSPLVDEQTRILKRGGRVQTTIIASDHGESGHLADGFTKRESTILQENNFDSSAERPNTTQPLSSATPDEVGALSSNNPSRRESRAKAETSRLPSRQPNEDAGGIENGNSRTEKTDEQSFHSGSSLEPETHSPQTGSRSANSSAGQRSGSVSSAADSHSETTESKKTAAKIGSDNFETKQAKSNGNSHSQASHSSGSERRGSSTEQSDELPSQAGSFDCDHDEKNWINSKLVQ